MNDDDHHEARGAMLHRGIVEQRQEDMVRQMFKDEEEIARLRAENERLTYECSRWKDVAEKQASWETLWTEQVNRAEAAEREVSVLREALKAARQYMDATLAFVPLTLVSRIDAALAEMEKPNED